MFLRITSQDVQFNYGKKGWRYNFNEVAALGMLKKKNTYFFESISFVAAGIFLYYSLFYCLNYLYYPEIAVLCCILAAACRYLCRKDFTYYVRVTDKEGRVIKIKIKERDKSAILKELHVYDNLRFQRSLQKEI